MTHPDSDELRVRHYLQGLGARPLGHQEIAPPIPAPRFPEEPPMLPLLLAACLVPGALTVWLLRRHGWGVAVLAGAGATAALPLVLISGMLVFPPLGYAIGAAAALVALRDYDSGRLWRASTWATVAVIAVSCARWSS
ncbi:hypothetical protein [Streptomyces murinus]|uniref:hypothetical protein n=1 Tax=Streptomyces murinus TaxID=33900 RepID=UPI001F1C7E59|nr:hypothetical protein [Streptomyces murinus]